MEYSEDFKEQVRKLSNVLQVVRKEKEAFDYFHVCFSLACDQYVENGIDWPNA